MPAGLPGDTAANNAGNPSAGPFVIFDPLSGPKGSPFDAKKIDYTTGTPPGWSASRVPITVNEPASISTGGLSTGIGIGGQRAIGLTPDLPVLTPISYAIFKAGYDDDFQPGQKQTYNAPPPPGNTASNTVDSTRMYIGGGRMIVNPNAATQPGRPFTPSPYTAGISIAGAGQGSSRDAGAGPAFTGFALKMVSNTGTVAIANGGAVEGAFINRSGGSLAVGQSLFGSSNVALAAPS